MSKVMDDLKLAEGKKASFLSLVNEFQAQSSSILSLSLQWKDLDVQYASIRKSLLQQAQELALQGTEMEEARRRVEAGEIEVGVKLEAAQGLLDEARGKERELGLLKNQILKCDEELGLKTTELQGKERELGFRQRELNEIGLEICEKKRERDSIQKTVEEESKELQAGREKLAEVRNLILNCGNEHELKEKQLYMVDVELQAKERILDSVQHRVKESTEELEDKQKLLGSLERTLDEIKKEISVKEGELSSLQKSVEDQSKEVKIKKSHQDIELEVEECEEKLQQKRKLLDYMETSLAEHNRQISCKMEELSFLVKSSEEQSKQLELKQKEMDEVLIFLSDHSFEWGKGNDSELQEKKELDEVKKLSIMSTAEHEQKGKELTLLQMKKVLRKRRRHVNTRTAENLAVSKWEASERTPSHVRKRRAVIVTGFTSEKPFFQLEVTSYYMAMGQAHLPLAFTQTHIHKDEESLKLVVGDKTWTVGLLTVEQEKYRRLCANWKRFLKDNAVNPGDVCIFELIKGWTDVELKVTIVRDHHV